MPMYEMVLLLSKMDRTALKNALKRSAEYIFESGGTLRKMENLGFMELPYRMKTDKMYTAAHHFVFQYDASAKQMKTLREKFRLDRDVAKATAFLLAENVEEKYEKKENPPCDIYKDFLPPPQRPAVLKIKQTEKKKKRYDLHTELPYNPF